MSEVIATAAGASDDEIRRRAIERVAKVFRKPIEEVKPEMAWGDQLKPSFTSDWRDNEYDELLDDVLYVADRTVRKELQSGARTIRTVGDYCDHMVRCYATRPIQVADALALPGHEAKSFVKLLLKRFGF